MIISILIIGGLAVGVMSSFFGIGGGAIMVPLLYALFPTLDNTIIISTSLTTVFFITTINSYQFFREKYFKNKKQIVLIIFSTIIGGLTGGLFTNVIGTEPSKQILAVILFLSLVRLYFYQEPENKKKKIQSWKLILTGLMGSFISSITGLGGGIVFVPMLLSFVMLDSKRVSAYSNLMMMTATLMGALPHLFTPIVSIDLIPTEIAAYFIGKINLGIVTIFVLGGVIGAFMGRIFNNSIGASLKKKLFSLLLLALIAKLLFF
ncbi:MAG: hypothetical protein CME62_03390 [Halobacteriovoraceae bacterium]|nr:hypothetical protein [Halobacteriovoraceae bacterium]|tara:strand:- start:30697 stop:31485 length:789 start_codon:yes stop_codon:yes gene_type:complete